MYTIISALVMASVATGAPFSAQPCAWSALGRGVDDSVSALVVFDDGRGEALYAGGSFRTTEHHIVNHIAKWDGAEWSPLGSGLSSGIVFDLAVFDDRRGGGPALYAGGSFETSGGKPVRGVAKWNGASWEEVSGGIAGGASKPRVSALCVFDDGSGSALYAGGSFGSIGGAPDTSFIAKWDGERWTSVGGGMHSYVYALEVHDDGSGPALYAAGIFRAAVGSPFDYIARWDGNSWSGVGGGMNDRVNKLWALDYGTGELLYAAGRFTSAGGDPIAYLASWDGESWSQVEGDTGAGALAVFDDGRGPALYVGGGFTEAGGVPASRIARWDGVRWETLGAGIGGGTLPGVSTMAVFDDGEGPALYVAGGFSTAGGAPAHNIARWRCDACYADCDGSGDLTFFDFLCFQNLFAVMDPGADCDGDGEFTFFDFLCFQNAFAAGCP